MEFLRLLSPVIPRNALTTKELLGEGRRGQVLQATWDGTVDAGVTDVNEVTDVAIKYLGDGGVLKRIVDDINSIAQYNHPNIVRLYGVCIGMGDSSAVEHCQGLVFELMSGEPLRHLLANKKQDISWDTRREIAIEIGKGVQYLHEKNIVLDRDLQSITILLTADLHAKIRYLGPLKQKLAHQLSSEEKNYSVSWRSPESFEPTTKLTSSKDIYSYGMVLWEIASREIPFAGVPEQTLVHLLKAGGKKRSLRTVRPILAQ